VRETPKKLGAGILLCAFIAVIGLLVGIASATPTLTEWLLPVPERLGEDLAAAISLRATTRRGAER
jgi:hypothetical protein